MRTIETAEYLAKVAIDGEGRTRYGRLYDAPEVRAGQTMWRVLVENKVERHPVKIVRLCKRQ